LAYLLRPFAYAYSFMLPARRIATRSRAFGAAVPCVGLKSKKQRLI